MSFMTYVMNKANVIGRAGLIVATVTTNIRPFGRVSKEITISSERY